MLICFKSGGWISRHICVLCSKSSQLLFFSFFALTASQLKSHVNPAEVGNRSKFERRKRRERTPLEQHNESYIIPDSICKWELSFPNGDSVHHRMAVIRLNNAKYFSVSSFHFIFIFAPVSLCPIYFFGLQLFKIQMPLPPLTTVKIVQNLATENVFLHVPSFSFPLVYLSSCQKGF